MKQKSIKPLITAAFLLAIGMVLPLLTGQMKEIGDSLLPMHFAVLLCGLLCGPYYGGAVGAVLPFLRGGIFGMPPLYPNAVWMAAELCSYGLVAGLCMRLFKIRRIGRVYVALVIAMIAGRVVWAVTKAALLGIAGKSFPFSAMLAGGVVDALPGIALQVLLLPPLTRLLEKGIDKE